jgi:hypothetical protein
VQGFLSFVADNAYAARPQPDACSRPWVAILQLVGVSLAGLARLGLATSLGGIVRSPRKVWLAQCVSQGNSGVTIWRVSPSERAPYCSSSYVCGHKRQLPIGEAIKLFGLETMVGAPA